jgi:hypothetical protein
MATVTITLSVCVDDFINYPSPPGPDQSSMGTLCRLSQSGGEEIGNRLLVIFSQSTINTSLVTDGDYIIWNGVDTGAPDRYQIDIVDITHEAGKSLLLSVPLAGTSITGSTRLAQATLVGNSDVAEAETYTIHFKIITQTKAPFIDPGPYKFDPKMRVKAH